jgi:hypothetical protein
MSNVTLYILGTILVAFGVAYGVSLFLGTAWALVVGSVALGLGVMASVSTRRPERPPTEHI